MVSEDEFVQHLDHRIAQTHEAHLRGTGLVDNTMTRNDAGYFDGLRQHGIDINCQQSGGPNRRRALSEPFHRGRSHTHSRRGGQPAGANRQFGHRNGEFLGAHHAAGGGERIFQAVRVVQPGGQRGGRVGVDRQRGGEAFQGGGGGGDRPGTALADPTGLR